MPAPFFRAVAVGAFLVFAAPSCSEEQRNALFPPEDYYDSILELQKQKSTTVYSGDLLHRFAGKYSISLAFEKPTPVAEGDGFDQIDVACALSVGDRSVNLPCGESLLHYWGDQSGVSIALYTVPKGVPKNVRVGLQVAFRSESALDELLDAHGKVSITVKKWSDL